uniref:Uncharacterized protein n=1 Tax=Arundo donax TaxID=35708 RepID=A0A0A9E560_ARUDO
MTAKVRVLEPSNVPEVWNKTNGSHGVCTKQQKRGSVAAGNGNFSTTPNSPKHGSVD